MFKIKNLDNTQSDVMFSVHLTFLFPPALISRITINMLQQQYLYL